MSRNVIYALALSSVVSVGMCAAKGSEIKGVYNFTPYTVEIDSVKAGKKMTLNPGDQMGLGLMVKGLKIEDKSEPAQTKIIIKDKDKVVKQFQLYDDNWKIYDVNDGLIVDKIARKSGIKTPQTYKPVDLIIAPIKDGENTKYYLRIGAHVNIKPDINTLQRRHLPIPKDVK